jgi:integrase
MMPLNITAALPQFEEYLEGRGLAAGTIERHMHAARGFAGTCRSVKGAGATMGQVDPQCVSKFFAAHTGGQGSRNNKIESLRHFLRWAERNHYLRPAFTAEGLLDGYKARKAERAPKYYVDAPEFPAALEASGARHPRDRAVIALGLFTLGRQSEIASLRLCDLDMAGRTVRMYRGKLKRWTDTGMSPELHDELTRWLQFYAREEGYLSPHTMIREHPDWLAVPAKKTFRAKGGGTTSRLVPDRPMVAMERVAKRMLTDLGVAGTRQGSSVDHKGEGMHTIRRSGARAMLKNLSERLGHQRALVQVSIMLDHEDTKMTLRYIGMDQEKDELNDWLRGNSMYETTEPPPLAAVVPLRGVM